MIKRIPFLRKSYYFIACFRYNPLRIDSLWSRRKFLNNASNNTKLRMGCKYFKFLLTTVRAANIVAIHSGNQIIAAFLHADLKGMT